MAGQTAIRGVHVGQLRQAVDAVRAAAGLRAAWDSYLPATGHVFAADFLALRDRLNEGRAALQLPLVDFTTPVGVNSVIHAAHVNALRGGVQ